MMTPAMRFHARGEHPGTRFATRVPGCVAQMICVLGVAGTSSQPRSAGGCCAGGSAGTVPGRTTRSRGPPRRPDRQERGLRDGHGRLAWRRRPLAHGQTRPDTARLPWEAIPVRPPVDGARQPPLPSTLGTQDARCAPPVSPRPSPADPWVVLADGVDDANARLVCRLPSGDTEVRHDVLQVLMWQRRDELRSADVQYSSLFPEAAGDAGPDAGTRQSQILIVESGGGGGVGESSCH